MSACLDGRGASAKAPPTACEGARKKRKGVFAPLVSFAQDKSGEVALMFGLMAIVMFMMIGLAVDFGRWINARNQTVAAADAAVLAAARALQTNGGDKDAAITVARDYYSAAVQDRLTITSNPPDTVDFDVVDEGTAVKTKGNAYIRTPFMSLGGISHLPLLRASGADYSKAKLAVGNDSGTNIEISMMLDVTGSMAGTKIKDLKLAASDLIKIVVWDKQTEYTSKVAIAPFAPRVNVGDYAPALTGLAATKKNKSNKTVKLITCVTERTGSYEFTEDAPAKGRYLSAYNGTTSADDDKNYSSNGTCSAPDAKQSILPMTNDKQALLDRIDKLGASGATAGQLGTAWAWYLISPQWASVWPAESKPAPYSDMAVLNKDGKPSLKKIAVLMTDGAYNTKGGTQYGDNSNEAKQIATNAVKLCTNMKAKGIEVYTVGFALGNNQTILNTMRNCATDESHFYNSSTGDALRQAFRDIALKISSLYLAE